MSAALEGFVTEHDYLAGEERSEVRHEYVRGRVFAMAGGSDAHATIVGNVHAELRAAVRGGACRAFMLVLKVRVEEAGAYYYPDVFVTCDERDRALEAKYAKAHPKVVIEVLSPYTAAFDRGEKFADYRKLPSLEEYVLVDSESVRVDVFRRGEAGRWVLEPLEAGGILRFESLGVEVEVDSLYEDVELTEPAARPGGVPGGVPG